MCTADYPFHFIFPLELFKPVFWNARSPWERVWFLNEARKTHTAHTSRIRDSRWKYIHQWRGESVPKNHQDGHPSGIHNMEIFLRFGPSDRQRTPDMTFFPSVGTSSCFLFFAFGVFLFCRFDARLLFSTTFSTVLSFVWPFSASSQYRAAG